MKKQNGITLIALIITIIVMLILVGVSVTVALNGGLFTTAKQAKQDTATERDKELNLSDGKVEINGEWYNSIDEYVNGGNSSIPEEPTEPGNPTGYTAYSIGQEVTVGGENFYVIKESGSLEATVTLLAKDWINTESLVQGGEEADTVSFVEDGEADWEEGDGLYDIVFPEPIPDKYVAAKAAYDYGAKLGGTGRLLTYSEATSLASSNPEILYLNVEVGEGSIDRVIAFYLGSTEGLDTSYFVDCYYDEISCYDLSAHGFTGVRPVVEISKFNIS